MINKIYKDDEASRKEFEAYLEVWERSENLKEYDHIDVDEDWQNVRSRMRLRKVSKRLPLSTFLVRIAAILVLALGLAFLLVQIMQKASNVSTQYFETASADNTELIELPDGSTISLNKNSKIIRNNDFGKTNRDVILEGEAYFEVTRNESLPFKVHSLNSTVEVLGTRFDIKTDSSEVVVGVLSGRVAFYESTNLKNRIVLDAENTGYYNAVSGKMDSHDSFDPNQIAWHTHRFIFVDLPINEVGGILADYYGLELKPAENIKSDDKVNINCSTESLDEVLYTINHSLLDKNLRLLRDDNYLIVRRQ